MNEMGKELNILWLWPDILNLHGDRGNVMALVRVCGLYGIGAKVTRVNRLSDDFDPERADIILLGPGELAVMPQIAGALSKHFAELKSWTESSGVLFATGTTGAALGVQTRRLDGSYIFGLGLLDIECGERKEILGDDLIFRTPGGLGIYGIQIQLADIHLAAGQRSFGKIVYGYGNNGGEAEGAESGNVIFTNALGPILVKNPWLALDLINRARARSAQSGDRGHPLAPDPDLFKFEYASAKAIGIFNEKKERPR